MSYSKVNRPSLAKLSSGQPFPEGWHCSRGLALGLLTFVVTSLAVTPVMAAPQGKIEPAKAMAQTHKPKPEGAQTKAVNSEMDSAEAAKRKQLLATAQSAVSEANNALQALDANNPPKAISDLELATGKLELVIAQNPNLALAPVGVSTVVHDVYAGPGTAKQAINQVKSLLDAGKVQQARNLLTGLASEVDIQVENIPLGTYPAAIKAIAPLINAGKMSEAKTELAAALNTLVVQTNVIPLPPIRAKAMLDQANELAQKSKRTKKEDMQLHENLEAARNQIKLAEVLGYGTKASYKPIYAQINKIEKKTEGGKSSNGFFNKIDELLKNTF